MMLHDVNVLIKPFIIFSTMQSAADWIASQPSFYWEILWPVADSFSYLLRFRGIQLTLMVSLLYSCYIVQSTFTA